MKTKMSFSAAATTAVSILALSFQACDKKADSVVQPDNGLEKLSDPAVTPRVIATTPSNNAVGPFSTYAPGPNSAEPHFIVQFNKYMNLARISDLTVSCSGFGYPVHVVAIYEYYNGWRRADGTLPDNPGSVSGTTSPFRELIGFQIVRSPDYYQSANYDIGKTYTITIDSAIQDINGNHMSEPYSFSFTPEPRFRSTGTYPLDGSKENSMYYSHAYVYFNSPIASDLLSSIHVTPAVQGAWSVDLDYDSLCAMTPSANQIALWDFGKTYQITVDAGAADARGNVLGTQFKSTFSTAPFKVTDTYPNDGTTMSYLSSSVYISFNANLDASTIASAITVSPSPASGIIYDFSYSSNYVYLRPSLGYNGGKTYSVTIAQTLKTQNGTPFPNPLVFRFATAPFQVRYTNPPNGTSNFNRYSSIRIETNGPIDPNTLGSSMSISPSASILWYQDGSSLSCYSSGSLAASTTYTVTVRSGLRSMAGDSLAASYSFTFTTGQ